MRSCTVRKSERRLHILALRNGALMKITVPLITSGFCKFIKNFGSEVNKRLKRLYAAALAFFMAKNG
jgi:hypothetical protein